MEKARYCMHQVLDIMVCGVMEDQQVTRCQSCHMMYSWVLLFFIEEAIGLVLANDTKVPLVIEQGKTFTIAINCVNEKGEIVCAG